MREKKIISVGASQLSLTHTHAHIHIHAHTQYHRCSPFRKQHFKVNTLIKTRERERERERERSGGENGKLLDNAPLRVLYL